MSTFNWPYCGHKLLMKQPVIEQGIYAVSLPYYSRENKQIIFGK